MGHGKVMKFTLKICVGTLQKLKGLIFIQYASQGHEAGNSARQ